MHHKKSSDQLIKKIAAKVVNSNFLTPLNIEREREKVFKDFSYNPQFTYKEFDRKALETSLEDLDLIVFPKNQDLKTTRDKKRVRELKLRIKVLLSRGTKNISDTSSELYQCHFDQRSLDQAKKDASISIKFKRRETLTPKQTVEKITSYLKENYNITNWKISVSQKHDFNVRIISNKKELYVSKSINWDFADLDSMLAHEVDCHIIRKVNSQKQKKETLRKTFPFYLKTEEGLASFVGDYFSASGKIGIKHHALKYLGGHLALKSSFADTFKFLMNHGFTKELAFKRTMRLKRGFEDTSMPGCHAKEAMYYEGMLEVKDFLESGGSIKKLYAGKASIEDLKYFPIPKGQIIPKRLKSLL